MFCKNSVIGGFVFCLSPLSHPFSVIADKNRRFCCGSFFTATSRRPCPLPWYPPHLPHLLLDCLRDSIATPTPLTPKKFPRLSWCLSRVTFLFLPFASDQCFSFFCFPQYICLLGLVKIFCWNERFPPFTCVYSFRSHAFLPVPFPRDLSLFPVFCDLSDFPSLCISITYGTAIVPFPLWLIFLSLLSPFWTAARFSGRSPSSIKF